MLQIQFPAALALVPLAVAAVVLLTRRSSLGGVRRAFATGVRILAVTLLAVAVASPTVESHTRRPHHVTFVMDVSDSIPDAALERGMRFIERESARLESSGDGSSLLLFGGRPVVVRAPASEPIRFGSDLRSKVLHRRAPKDQRETILAWRQKIRPDQTRLQPALSEARLLAASPARQTIVLLTDGQADDLLQAPVDSSIVLQPLASDAPQARVTAAQVPLFSRFGEPFDLKADITATGTTRGTLRISVDGQPRPDLERAVDLLPGSQTFTFSNIAGKSPLASGLHRIEVHLQAPEDPERANKTGVGVVHVLGKPRVLLLREAKVDEEGIAGLLKLQDIDVVTEVPSRVASLAPELNSFDSVILLGAPDPSVPEDVWAVLNTYVNDAGGGFLFVADPSVAALPRPLEALLPVAFDPPAPPSPEPPAEPPPAPPTPPPPKIENKKVKAPPVTLLILIDKSGSMAGTNIALAKEACLASIKTLSDNDYVGIIAFDSRPHWVVKPTVAGSIKAIEDQVLRLHASGGTDVYAALVEAEAVMSKVTTPIRHVLLLSDGETNPENFEALADRMASSGVTISTITLLQGNFDLALMKSIAEHGKGRYLWASDPRSLPQIFTTEVRQIVGDAKPSENKTPAEPLPVVKPPEPKPPEPPAPQPKKKPEPVPFQPLVRGVHESTEGIDFAKSPALKGMLAGKAKPSSLVPLVGSRDERPLLAFWRFGLGKCGAWTSDFGSEWSREFIAWPGAPKLMAQVIRTISSNLRTSSLYSKIRIHQDGGRATISADVADLSAQLTQPAVLPLTVQHENGRSTMSLELTDAGQLYQLTLRSGDESALIGLVSPTPRELLNGGLNSRVFGPGSKLDERLALGEAPPAPASENLGAWLLIPAMALLTLDLLIRRIRL